MNQYRCVVIGCGKVGLGYEADADRVIPRSHVEAIRLNVQVQLVGVCDENVFSKTEAVDAYAPGINSYSDAKECLAHEKPDIVIISASTGAHKELIGLACDFGAKMIICEKPLCKNASEAEEVGKKLRAAGIVFVLNYQRRFFPVFKTIRKDIAQGVIGTIQQITCCYSNGLYNNAGHLLDATMFLLRDRVVSVSGIVNTRNLACPEGDQNIDGIMEFKGGARIALQSFDQRAYGMHELTIYGTTGSIHIREHGYTAEWYRVQVRAGIPVFKEEKKKRNEESFVKGALDEVISCYEQGREPVSGLENGTDVLRALDAISSSAMENGILTSVSYPSKS